MYIRSICSMRVIVQWPAIIARKTTFSLDAMTRRTELRSKKYSLLGLQNDAYRQVLSRRHSTKFGELPILQDQHPAKYFANCQLVWSRF